MHRYPQKITSVHVHSNRVLYPPPDDAI